MYLIYLDESGNTGADLDDLQQPVFLLGALIVEDRVWPALAKELDDAYRKIFFDLHFASVEVHAGDLIGGRGPFKGLPVGDRVALRNAWLEIAGDYGLKFVYRAIRKVRLKTWAAQQFPEGLSINPHTIAFPLVAKVVNHFLEGLPGEQLGILISDENKEIVDDVEELLRSFQGRADVLNLNRIIEKGFFIDSKKSLILQLCDVCAYTCRKIEEGSEKPLHTGPKPLMEAILHRGDEQFMEYLKWLESNHLHKRKKRPGK